MNDVCWLKYIFFENVKCVIILESFIMLYKYKCIYIIWFFIFIVMYYEEKKNIFI